MKLPEIKGYNPSRLQTQIITHTNQPAPPVQSPLKPKYRASPSAAKPKKKPQGRNLGAALSLIHGLDLDNEIFSPPVQDAPIRPVQDMKIAGDIVRHKRKVKVTQWHYLDNSEGIQVGMVIILITDNTEWW